MTHEFETLLRNNDSDLGIIRKKYYPMVAKGIIKGYNIYESVFSGINDILRAITPLSPLLSSTNKIDFSKLDKEFENG